MKYLKVFLDFEDAIEPINDAEAGRLFRAMLRYARTGETPKFSGNERYVWPTAKLNIDREVAFCEKQRRNASKPTEAKQSQTEPTEAKQSQTSQKDKDKDKDNKFITVLPSFVHSPGEDPEADKELERMIERLQLHVYRGSERSFARSVESAIRIMWYSNSIKANGRRIGQGAVRSVLRELTIDHIDAILNRLRNMDPEEPVTNGQSYLMACIYNAPADCAVNAERAEN